MDFVFCLAFLSSWFAERNLSYANVFRVQFCFVAFLFEALYIYILHLIDYTESSQLFVPSECNTICLLLFCVLLLSSPSPSLLHYSLFLSYFPCVFVIFLNLFFSFSNTVVSYFLLNIFFMRKIKQTLDFLFRTFTRYTLFTMKLKCAQFRFVTAWQMYSFFQQSPKPIELFEQEQK